MTHPTHRAWAEIDASALVHNIRTLQARFGGGKSPRIMAVVKADAYGHGIDAIVPICLSNGIRDFGVATVSEGVHLRELGPDAAIYLLGPIHPDEAESIVANRLIPMVSVPEMGDALSRAAVARRT